MRAGIIDRLRCSGVWLDCFELPTGPRGAVRRRRSSSLLSFSSKSNLAFSTAMQKRWSSRKRTEASMDGSCPRKFSSPRNSAVQASWHDCSAATARLARVRNSARVSMRSSKAASLRASRSKDCSALSASGEGDSGSSSPPASTPEVSAWAGFGLPRLVGVAAPLLSRSHASAAAAELPLALPSHPPSARLCSSTSLDTCSRPVVNSASSLKRFASWMRLASEAKGNDFDTIKASVSPAFRA